MRGASDVLRFVAQFIRDVRRTDFARSFAEVFAFVVEGKAGIDFDLEHRERLIFEHADRQLAAFDEFFDNVGDIDARYVIAA